MTFQELDRISRKREREEHQKKIGAIRECLTEHGYTGVKVLIGSPRTEKIEHGVVEKLHGYSYDVIFNVNKIDMDDIRNCLWKFMQETNVFALGDCITLLPAKWSMK